MLTAVILAGGLGTRLRQAVPDLPKPMASVRGRPFLEHLLDYWIGQGVGRFILSTGYRGETIRAHFGERYRDAVVNYAQEETPLGTGGGLLRAAEGLVEPFLLLNGDTFFEVDAKGLLAFHAARGAQWTFSLFVVAGDSRYMGMELDADGRVTRLKAGPAVAGSLANGGVYVIDPAALTAWRGAPETKVSLEDELLPALLEAGVRIYGMASAGRFIDIGVPDDYFRAGEVLP